MQRTGISMISTAMEKRFICYPLSNRFDTKLYAQSKGAVTMAWIHGFSRWLNHKNILR